MAPESTAEDNMKDLEAATEHSEEENAQEPEQRQGQEGSDSGSGSGSPSASKSPSPELESAPAETPASAPAQWQAVWSPQYNAYYFYNALTQETTWTNPLAPDASTSASASASASTSTPAPGPSASHPAPEEPNANAEAGPSQPQQQMSSAQAQYAALQAAALAQGIDPLLAHLDPSLVAAVGAGSGGPGDIPSFKAHFNAHTGRFTAANARTPGHLSEYERAKRMSEFYFDVGKWEEELARQGGSIMGGGEGEEGEGEGRKRKRPSKKDIERFKEQKRQKKLAKTAWLRT